MRPNGIRPHKYSVRILGVVFLIILAGGIWAAFGNGFTTDLSTKIKISSVSLSPHADQIAVSFAAKHTKWKTSRILVYNISQKSIFALPPIGSWNLFNPSFSVDGGSIIATAQPSISDPKQLLSLSQSARLVSIRLGERSWRTLVSRRGVISDPSYTVDGKSVVFRTARLKEVSGKIRFQDKNIMTKSLVNDDTHIIYNQKREFLEIRNPIYHKNYLYFTSVFDVAAQTTKAESVREVVVIAKNFPSLPFRLPLKKEPNSDTEPELFLDLFSAAGELTNLKVSSDGKKFFYVYFKELGQGSKENYGRGELRMWDGERTKIIATNLTYIWDVGISANGSHAAVLAGSWDKHLSDVYLVNSESGKSTPLNFKDKIVDFIDQQVD